MRQLSLRSVLAGIVALAVGVGAFFGLQSLLATDDAAPAPEPVVVEAPVEAPPPEPEPAPEPEPVAEPEPEPEPESALPTVLTATMEIRPGDRLTSAMLEWREWDGPVNANFAFIEDDTPLNTVLGAIAKQPMERGSLIAWDKIIMPGGPGFLTSMLSPGYRAVTIEADRATTNANIIRPGDRVDVILTHESKDVPGLAERGRIAQVIVADVLVLAVGSTTMASRPYFSTTLQDLIQASDAPPPNSETYTLEVAVEDAERVALASRQITLSLRPFRLGPKDDYRYPQLVGFDEVLNVAPEPEPEPEVAAAPPSVRVIRGASSTVTTLGPVDAGTDEAAL